MRNRKNINKSLVILIIGLSSFHAAIAQCSGCLDSSFGVNGIVTASVNNHTSAGWATDLEVQSHDGKIVVTVESKNIENTSISDSYVMRFDASGALDPTFDSDGIVRFAFSPDQDIEGLRAVAIQADGKIVVAGRVPATSSVGLARLNPDGTLDSSFGNGGKLTFQFVKREAATPNSVVVGPDGRITVAGRSNNKSFAFARFNPDGTLDPSFNATGKLNIVVSTNSSSACGTSSMILSPDGKYLASGSRCATNRDAQTFMVVRVNANGTIDSTFGSGGKVVTSLGGSWSIARNVAVDSNGRVVVGGDWLNNGKSWVFARYLAGGQLDQSFGSGGLVIFSSPGFRTMTGMAIQADGKIVGSGWDRASDSGDSSVLILRITADGFSLDSTFGNGGSTYTNYSPGSDDGNAIAVQSDGKFVVGGNLSPYGNKWSVGLLRYLP